jgi:DNA gyrase subunit A
MLITDTGRIIRTRVKEIRVISRNTQGVKLIDISPEEKVSDVARLDEKDDDDE